jgi:hypothetical protein
MALHRDIFWIGRQWAVTGHGMQLIDQKLQGFFDVAATQLWDDGLIEGMRAKEWLNAADFEKALGVARARYPRPPQPPTPLPVVAAIAAIAPVAPPPIVTPQAPKREEPAMPDLAEPVAPAHAAPEPAAPDLAEPPQSAPSDFDVRIAGHARFVRPWRVWMKPRA